MVPPAVARLGSVAAPMTMDMKPMVSTGGGPSQGTAVIPSHRASMGMEAMLLSSTCLPGHLLLEAVFQVQDPPLQGHVGDQALDEIFGEGLVSCQRRTSP